MPEVTDICKALSKKVLLVEGKNDCHVIMALCASHALPDSFTIYACDNREAAVRRFNAMIVSPDRPITLGLVIDADDNTAAEKWQTIQTKIAEHGYYPPQIPTSGGIIIQSIGNLPRLGIWIMPDNSLPGALEDFLCKMANQDALKQACACVDTALSMGIASFKQAHHSKAIIHTYLAWQDEPGKPLGSAITAKLLAHDSEAGQTFVAWLKDLFCS